MLGPQCKWAMLSKGYSLSDHLYGTLSDGSMVQSLNVSTGQWQALLPPSTQGSLSTLCSVDGRLFFVGGSTRL